MSSYKAYLSATGGLKSYVLTHDVKKVLSQPVAQGQGLVHILSLGGTTALKLIENDPDIITPMQQTVFSLFQSQIASSKPKNRRSGLSASAYHQMASLMGLELSLPFQGGKLLTSPFHEVMALDFEPKVGRREFLITILSTPQEGKA